MARRVIHSYVVGVCLGALCALFLLDWTSLISLTGPALLGFLVLVGVGFFSELLALSVKSAGHSSITFLPLLACQLLYGTPASVTFVLAVYVPIEIFIRHKEPVRAAFNLGQLTLAVSLAGTVFTVAGGIPLTLDPNPTIGLSTHLLPFVGFTAVFLGSNHLAVSFAIALQQGASFRRIWRNRAGRAAANSLYDLLVSPVAIGVAFLFIELGVLGILVALLPLLFVRHAYLTTYRLQAANRDLLKALVKAIETRDPYTSGHSMRVSQLAAGIAERMGLGHRRTHDIEAAALLHDIGKIDAVYTEILNKPGNLTSRERSVIQSHVLKGVELLESLASFDDRVIAAVRHHHERIDGKGYPDGLSGDDISVGGRIIKVCDAIDAMLSDRPYRSALSLPAVREQLTLYAGVQFDAEVVEIVVNSEILDEHLEQMQAAYAATRGGESTPVVWPDEDQRVHQTVS